LEDNKSIADCQLKTLPIADCRLKKRQKGNRQSAIF